MSKRLSKDALDLAGEFAVASELLLRGYSVSITMGKYKQTDIFVEKDGKVIKVQVKAKQGKVWRGIRGIKGKNTLLIFVDFENGKRDFYILDEKDWQYLLREHYIFRKEKGWILLKEGHIPVAKDGYEGLVLSPADVRIHKNMWKKIDFLAGDVKPAGRIGKMRPLEFLRTIKEI